MIAFADNLTSTARLWKLHVGGRMFWMLAGGTNTFQNQVRQY